MIDLLTGQMVISRIRIPGSLQQTLHSLSEVVEYQSFQDGLVQLLTSVLYLMLMTKESFALDRNAVAKRWLSVQP